jgi:hypothetical protein
VGHNQNPVTYIEDPENTLDAVGAPSLGRNARTHWCLVANTARYDVEAALGALPIVLWTVGRLRTVLPAPGDPVLVWRTLGSDGHRGLVARGMVDGEIALVPDDQDPFWIDPARGLVVEARVPIRWWSLARPLWLEHAPEVLGRLKASRNQGLSMVTEDPERWAAAARAAGGAPAMPPPTETSRGQGWMTVVDQRLAIEHAAMDAASDYYQAAGYEVEGRASS